jgi:hypothetical protein
MRLAALLLFTFTLQIAHAKFLETKCNDSDCFSYGWTTIEPGTDYLLKSTCTNNDCVNVGWSSLDNRNSSYLVMCKAGGCFEHGWVSYQNDNGLILIDNVSCKNSDCLSNGWNIDSTYDEGGEVICKNNDCGKFGGFSYWRNEISETKCLNSDCYRYGWTADIQRM